MLVETIPTDPEDIISVLDITQQLELVNEKLAKMEYIQPINEMLVNRIEILIVLQLVMLGLFMYSIFRRSDNG